MVQENKTTKLMTYTYNDIGIVPAIMSQIEHRSECNPFLVDEKDGSQLLPIFTAPMDSVVGIENYELYKTNHICPILPRTVNIETRLEYARDGKWAAFSLKEFETFFCGGDAAILMNNMGSKCKVVIDTANGHMQKIYNLVRKSKKAYGRNIIIMTGNIANPQTYMMAALCGIDYIRLSIGTGMGCITSSNVGIHYGIASLIADTRHIANSIRASCVINSYPQATLPKIIADGGIRGYSDIIKALALGADYVMVGGLLSSLRESSGKTEVNEETGESYKVFYGMASAEGQIAMKGIKSHTSEGIKKKIPLTTTINSWSTNMADYLRSAMSYCNCRDISQFNSENVTTVILSPNTYNSLNR